MADQDDNQNPSSKLTPEDTIRILDEARQKSGLTTQEQAQSRIEKAATEGIKNDPSQRLQAIKDTPDIQAQIQAGGIRGASAQIEQAAPPPPLPNELITPSNLPRSSLAPPAQFVQQGGPPPSQPSRLKRAGVLAGLGALVASGALSSGGSRQPRTKLSELYRYVGDDVVKELPSLRSGAQNWIHKLQAYPSLSSVQNQKDLAKWIQQNPNTGVSLGDFGNYEKYIRYQNFFPDADASENLQERLYAQAQSDRVNPSDQMTHSHPASGHFSLDFFTKMLEAKGLDQDPHFRRILKNVIKEHNRLNPDNPFREKLIVKAGKDKLLNPNLPPELVSQAKTIFGDAYGEDELKFLEEKEQSRIYKTSSNDPTLQKLQQTINTDVESELQTRAQNGQTVTPDEESAIRKKATQTHNAQFAKDYSEKAHAYSRKDPLIREAFKKQQKAQRQLNKLEWHERREANKLYRFSPQRDPAVKALREGTLTPEEFAKKYPRKANAYKRQIQEIGQARESIIAQQKITDEAGKQRLKEAKQLRRHKDPTTDSQLQGIKNTYANRATDKIQQQAFEKEMNAFVRNNDRASKRSYTQDEDIRAARERVRRARNTAKSRGRISAFIDNKILHKAKYLSTDYWADQARQKAFSALKKALGIARSGGAKSLEVGIKGASSAVPKVASVFRPAFSRLPAPGGIASFRPPIPPAAAGVLANPWVWVGIIILIFLFLLFFWFGGEEGNSENNISVSITKTGPPEVDNPTENIPTEFEYFIDVTYSGNPSSIEVTDLLPPEVEFVSASHNGTYNPTNHTVTWSIAVTGSGSSAPSTPGENLPHNQNTCSGIYASGAKNINDGGQHNGDNFGDPACELAQSYPTNGDPPTLLVDELQRLDPANADTWLKIIACEAPGYDPNNVSDFGGTSKPWGLFQMGASGSEGAGGWIDNPYQQGDGRNGPYDRGDVNWRQQVSNAINYRNKKLNGGWQYWECADQCHGLNLWQNSNAKC